MINCVFRFFENGFFVKISDKNPNAAFLFLFFTINRAFCRFAIFKKP